MLTILLLGLFLLFSCGEAVSTKRYEVSESYPNGQKKTEIIYEVQPDESKTKIGRKSYYENGTPKLEGFVNDKGRKNGHWKYWYENGNLWSECDFKDGMKHGESTVYYRDGKRRYHGIYKNDSTIGVWKFWDSKGNLAKEIDYNKNF